MSRTTPMLGLTAVATTVVALIAGAPAAQARAKDKTPPGPATSLTINGHTTSSTKANLTLSWTKPKAKDLKSVTVYRNTKNALTGAKKLVATTAASYVDKTVVPNHVYWYFLRATDKTGNTSAVSRLAARTSASKSQRVLTGVVADAKRTPLHDVNMELSRGSNYVDGTSTDEDGYFAFADAAYSANGLSLCWYSSTGNGGQANTTGYLAGCWNNRTDTSPKRANRLPLVAGEFRAVAITARAGGRLTGTVHDGGGRALSGVDVQLYDSDGDEVSDLSTESGGNFTFTSLLPGSRYTVELDASDADRTHSASGYVSRWLGGAAAQSYAPGTAIPSNVKSITLTAGQTTALAPTQLAVGGAVTGTATGSNDIQVAVYDASGNRVARAYTGSGENPDDPTSFTAAGLATGHYTVCANDFDGDAPSECWTGSSQVEWSGDTGSFPSSAAGKVSVTAGHTVTGVQLTLVQPGLIAGAVTGASSSDELMVQAFDSAGNEVDGADVDPSDPTYRIEVPQGAYTVCAVLDGPDVTASSECYTPSGSVPWDGDRSNFPSSAVGAVTVVSSTTTSNIDFDFTD